MEGRGHRFPLVHSMRGLAAISVLLYHALFKAYLNARPGNPLAPYAAHLDVGVSLFFLISGFVLYRPMVARRLAGEPPIDADAYGRRRLRRIVPAYWIALVIAGLAGASYLGYPKIFSAQGIAAYFGFLQIYSPDTAAGGINVAWTLCVEVTFYAFLPIWAMALRRVARSGGVRSEFVALGGLFIASFAWQLFAVHSTNVNLFGASAARWIEPLPNFLDQFAVGMALAVASVHCANQGATRIVRLVHRWPSVCWLTAAVAYWSLSTRIGLAGTATDHLTPARYLARHELNTVVAFALLVPAVFAGRGNGYVRRILRWPAFAFLGTVSYGIYLYHVPVLIRMGKWWGSPQTPASLALWLSLAIVAVLVLAALSWRWVERPLLSSRKRGERAPAKVTRQPALAGDLP
jgi:peptidoglycan/LPS O-acetylase OafA/YrhL